MLGVGSELKCLKDGCRSFWDLCASSDKIVFFYYLFPSLQVDEQHATSLTWGTWFSSGRARVKY